MRVAGSIIAALLALAAVSSPNIATSAPVTINGITILDQGISADERSINDVNLTPGFFLFPEVTYLVALLDIRVRAFLLQRRAIRHHHGYRLWLCAARLLHLQISVHGQPR